MKTDTNMDKEWPFEDPKNVIAITTKQVIEKGYPILYVSHDADDGCWQFHTGNTTSENDALVVALETIVKLDPSIKFLATLPYGWVAIRENKDDPWTRQEQQ